MTKHVLVATPAYKDPCIGMLASRQAACVDLTSRGVQVSVVTTSGDPYVERARHVITHLFLKSEATHLLQWDADLECLSSDAIFGMLGSGHDVVGCAYPIKDAEGMVCASPLEETVTIDEHGCMPVREVGTGFLLTSRAAIERLCLQYPDRKYVADRRPFQGEEMWALFKCGIHNRRYLGEDYDFCRLWRELGERVYAFLPPVFRHWGSHGYEAHIIDAWGLRPRQEIGNA